MYKITDNTKDNSTIVPFTKDYGPVAVMNHTENGDEVIFSPVEVESEGTDITVNNTYNDNLELSVYGKSELKFDFAQCEGSSSQVIHDRDSYNILDISDAEIRSPYTSYEQQEDGGFHVTGSREDGWAQFSFQKDFVLKAGTYYGCGKNNTNIAIEQKISEAPGYKLYVFFSDGRPTVLEEDVPVVRAFFQWPGGGTQIDEIVYPYIGTQFSEEYEPYCVKTPTLENPSPITPMAEGGYNVLEPTDVTINKGLAYELLNDGGYHVTGTTTAAYAMFIIAQNYPLKAGTYYGLGQNKSTICVQYKVNEEVKYLGVSCESKAVILDADIIATKIYTQWGAAGTVVDEVIYPYVGTEFVYKYTPFGSNYGKYQLNHNGKKYEVQLPRNLHGFSWDDIKYKDILGIDFLHKKYTLRKNVVTCTVPITSGLSPNAYKSGLLRVYLSGHPAKKDGLYTVGNCAFATAIEKEAWNKTDYICPIENSETCYWHPDLGFLGVSVGETDIDTANERLQTYLASLSAEERTVTYALAEEIIYHGDITEVESSTMPELPLKAIEIAEQSIECPAVIQATEGTVTIDGSIRKPSVPVTAKISGLHGLELPDDSKSYDYIDKNGKKFVSDYVIKTRELINNSFVDKVQKVQKLSLKTLTSNMPWSAGDGYFYTTIDKAPGIANVACSHFKNDVIGSETEQTVKFYPPFTDLDEWKALLDAQATAGTPAQVLYELAEPTVEDITETAEGQAILQLKTIPYGTRIYSDADYHIKAKMRTWKGGES